MYKESAMSQSLQFWLGIILDKSIINAKAFQIGYQRTRLNSLKNKGIKKKRNIVSLTDKTLEKYIHKCMNVAIEN